MDELKTNDYLKGIVLNLPESPGIYQYLNAEGTIIYVGKAKNLKRRVSSYFNREHEPGKTRVLVSKIADIRYIVVNTEEDALLLENNLIKKYKPRYNVLLKDDKTYPWIVVRRENFHLRAERIFPPRIQDAENHTQRFFLLRPVQPHTIHVCSARPHQAFVPATHLQFESLARKHPGREVQCMPGIPHQELRRPLHRQAESGRIPQKHRRNKGNTQGKYPGDRADAVSADAGACGGNEV